MLRNDFATSLTKKSASFTAKLASLFKTRIKNKKRTLCIECDQSKWLKPYIEFNMQKRIEAGKNCDKRWKSILQINKQSCIW